MQQTGIPVVRTERGGSITYHGPGQAVGYPILRLTDYCAGPKAYVRRLEDVLIATLGEWAIQGRRREGLPGVGSVTTSRSRLRPSACGSRGASPCTDLPNVSLISRRFSSIIPLRHRRVPMSASMAALWAAPRWPPSNSTLPPTLPNGFI